jgi:uncharacterized glyoxalase superfamily protein PhnB
MTKVNPVPEGLRAVTPALSIDGCAEAMELYKKAFNAVETARALDPSGKKVWHGEMRIGDSAIFVNDVFPDMDAGPHKSSLWLYCDDIDFAFARAAKAGLKVTMPLADMFWGDRMGSFVDKWGNAWTLAQRIQNVTPQEMQKAQDAFVTESKKKK